MKKLIVIIVLLSFNISFGSSKKRKIVKKCEIVRIYMDKNYKVKKELNFITKTRKYYV